jgi:hypothetical protein
MNEKDPGLTYCECGNTYRGDWGKVVCICTDARLRAALRRLDEAIKTICELESEIEELTMVARRY